LDASSASLFFLFGSVMEILPSLFPGWFPRTGLDGSNSQALWLHVMGGVQAAIAIAYFGRQVVFPHTARLAHTIGTIHGRESTTLLNGAHGAKAG